MVIKSKWKKQIRRCFFSFLQKIMETERFKESIKNSTDQQLYNRFITSTVDYISPEIDFPELGYPPKKILLKRDDIIFISGRFRSGSTFLWNIFRNTDGITAYYEPLIEESPENRGTAKKHGTDPTHIGVKDYHAEYKNIPELTEHYSSQWAFHHLIMDPYHFDPKLEKYIDCLIQKAPSRPVLQFNRADFRLQWLKTKYPNASILFLYRHPRNQWMSMIEQGVAIPRNYRWDKNDLWPDINTFYLWDWWRDLHFQMPFLKLEHLEHPYQIHYLLWRMSYIYGFQFSDYQIRYETLLDSFESEIEKCFKFLHIDNYDMDQLLTLKKNPSQKIKWRKYADDIWFETLEEKSEQLLISFFSWK